MQDLYKVLDVPKKADKAAIKRAYRKKSMQTHPDTANGSVKSFALVKKAYDTLSDDNKRKRYDRTGEADDVMPDNGFSDAINIIAGIFNAVLQECAKQGQSPLEMDIVQKIKACIDSNITEILKQQRILKNVLETDKKLHGRFKKKIKCKTADNIMENIIKFRIMEINKNLLRFEKSIKDHREAEKIISEFTFKSDPNDNDHTMERFGIRFMGL